MGLFRDFLGTREIFASLDFSVVHLPFEEFDHSNIAIYPGAETELNLKKSMRCYYKVIFHFFKAILS